MNRGFNVLAIYLFNPCRPLKETFLDVIMLFVVHRLVDDVFLRGSCAPKCLKAEIRARITVSSHCSFACRQVVEWIWAASCSMKTC